MPKSGTRATVHLDMRKLEEIERNFPGRASDYVMELALTCEAEAKTSMNTSPPGRAYGNHVASQPGYPPNIDTGTLLNSIQAVRLGKYSAATNVNAEHGVGLEYGDPSSNLAPRPFLLPAVERTVQKLGKGAITKVVTG